MMTAPSCSRTTSPSPPGTPAPPPNCAVVAAEVEYLSAQLWQLPIMQQALEESEALGHTCPVHGAPPQGEEQKDRCLPFSDGAEQQQLAMLLSSIS